MINRRSARLSGRALSRTAGAALLALAAPLPAAAQMQVGGDPVAAAISDAGGLKEVRAFYAARDGRPLWVRGGAIGPEADALVRLIETADLDRLDSGDYHPRGLAAAVKRAREERSPKALAKAELLLSRSFAELARDMRTPRDVGVTYADAELKPSAPRMRALLDEAAAAPSLADFVAGLGWMSPIYAKLRLAAVAEALSDGRVDELIRLNLDRARALPTENEAKRFVLVDAAAARLWMYENGRVAGTMRVVVGKPSEPTPMMAALIRYASVNPYWNIPPDLVRVRVAPGAIEQGPGFLKAKRFEALSGWEADARVVDPKTIDWAAVQAGRIDARVRQLPGPNNAMGRIKFMFPNQFGVYLHDTPEKDLLKEDARLFSSGCVRVEDAPRLARWLFGRPVSTKISTPEKRVDLAEPVPVYITYLTAAGENDRLVFRSDPYGRDKGLNDGQRLAAR